MLGSRSVGLFANVGSHASCACISCIFLKFVLLKLCGIYVLHSMLGNGHGYDILFSFPFVFVFFYLGLV